VNTSEIMLGLVTIGSLLTLVYLFIEFVWWSPTTNDRRHTPALGQRGLTSNEQKGASVPSLKTDLVIPLATRADNRFEETALSAARSRNVGTPQATGLSSR
jgi:hypothetical protein